MIRVKKNRCGYTGASGYVCEGIEGLDLAFSRNILTCDTSVNRTTFTDPATETDPHLIDNYYNLPVKPKGLIMSLDKNVNMDASLPYPEKTCNASTDPLTSAGFLDLFNLYGNRVIGRTGESGAYTDLTTSLLCTTTVDSSGNKTDLVYYPGVLEPMLDTQFSPVVVDGITGIDAYLDGVFYAISLIIKWRKIVDEKLSNIQTSSGGGVGSIKKLLIAMNTESHCDEFQIEKTSGDILYKGSSHTVPTYRVSGGTIYVNGNAVSISSKSGISGEFNAFINLTFEELGDNEGYNVTGEIATHEADDYSISLGGVKLHTSEKYKIYKIWQESCYADVDIVRADDGFLYRGGEGEIPYIAYQAATCPTDDDE